MTALHLSSSFSPFSTRFSHERLDGSNFRISEPRLASNRFSVRDGRRALEANLKPGGCEQANHELDELDLFSALLAERERELCTNSAVKSIIQYTANLVVYLFFF